MIKHLAKRFSELAVQVQSLEATARHEHSHFVGEYIQVDGEMFLSWCVKTKNLIVKACGEDSQHFKAFEKAEIPIGYSSNHSILQKLKGVFFAAKEDFEGGYLVSVKNLICAELFDSELEQSKELLAAGYKSAAAVIAGVVLETTLRSLCDENEITHGKLDKMNSDLAKKGIYNSLVQKRITALAGIRNSAAHGNQDEFEKADVENMIIEIERFIATNLS